MRFTTIILCLALITYACGGGGSDDQASKPTVKVKDKSGDKKEQQDSPSAEVLAAGKTVFTTYCVVCHGEDGKLGLNGAKDMTVSTLTREEMVTQVTKGKGAMAAYESILKYDEIQAVVDYVRSLKGS